MQLDFSKLPRLHVPIVAGINTGPILDKTRLNTFSYAGMYFIIYLIR